MAASPHRRQRPRLWTSIHRQSAERYVTRSVFEQELGRSNEKAKPSCQKKTEARLSIKARSANVEVPDANIFSCE